jgi:hypothetical protein
MPRGRKPKSATAPTLKTPEMIDAEIESVETQITELKAKLTTLKKDKLIAIAAKEQDELKLLGDKIRESGKTVEEWIKEITK